jgi:hypothetical protein
MHNLPRHDPHCGAFRRALTPILLLAAALVTPTGCTDSPTFVKPGALFVATEKAPPSKALVYFYWPPEEQGRWDDLLVSSCEGAYESVLPGGFTLIPVDPGRQCFNAQWRWNVDSISAFGGTELVSVDLKVKPGQTLFVRVEKEDGLSGVALRLVEPAKAEPEIGKCRQTIPMTPDEAAKVLGQAGMSVPSPPLTGITRLGTLPAVLQAEVIRHDAIRAFPSVA